MINLYNFFGEEKNYANNKFKLEAVKIEKWLENGLGGKLLTIWVWLVLTEFLNVFTPISCIELSD